MGGIARAPTNRVYCILVLGKLRVADIRPSDINDVDKGSLNVNGSDFVSVKLVPLHLYKSLASFGLEECLD